MTSGVAIAYRGIADAQRNASCTTIKPSMCMAATPGASSAVPSVTSCAWLRTCAVFMSVMGSACEMAEDHEIETVGLEGELIGFGGVSASRSSEVLMSFSLEP